MTRWLRSPSVSRTDREPRFEPGQDETALVRAEGLGRRFGRRVALAPLDFELGPGDSVALVGPNGAGKSTLLSLLAGALEPSTGTVERAAGIRVGWVPQRSAHYGRLTPRENLELFGRLESVADPESAAGRLLERFGLPDDGRLSDELSVGNRQRLDLALALLDDPDVLLLDEPTASLDPGQRARLWAEAEALRDAGGAVAFATQNLEEVERLGRRVVALRNGVVVFAGAADEWARLDRDAVFA
jgi:ABC-2 type transport system ATP-binding protein